MKTLVTGATGFIGSSVVRCLLERGREVKAMVEPGAPRDNLEGLEIEIVEADINDRAAVGRALEGCRTLHHLAAIYKLWMPDYRVMYDVNVEGTKTVLFAAMAANVEKVVYTSSISTLGIPPGQALSDETFEFDAWDEVNHYIRSKWLAERDALRFAAEGLPLVVVHPAFPFGPRDIGPTPTGKVVVDVLRGKVPGYLEGGFNAVDVRDVAEGHVRAEEVGRVGERYVLGGHNLTYREFNEMIAETAGIELASRKLPSPLVHGMAWVMEQIADRTAVEPVMTYKSARYATQYLWFDTTKAREELGLRPTPLRETIAASVGWFREHGYV